MLFHSFHKKVFILLNLFDIFALAKDKLQLCKSQKLEIKKTTTTTHFWQNLWS